MDVDRVSTPEAQPRVDSGIGDQALNLLRDHLPLEGKDGREYLATSLTRDLAERFTSELLALHNLIPHVTWTDEDLLSDLDEARRREYFGKWSLSLCALYEAAPVALLVAYIRRDNVRGSPPSLYIHRLAVAEEHQRNRVGGQLTQLAVDAYFRTVPGLKVVTVQTNDTADNEGVISFYRSLGFKDFSRVAYRSKQDVLLRYRRIDRWKVWTVHRRLAASWRGCVNDSARLSAHLRRLLLDAEVSHEGPSGWDPLNGDDPDSRRARWTLLLGSVRQLGRGLGALVLRLRRPHAASPGPESPTSVVPLAVPPSAVVSPAPLPTVAAPPAASSTPAALTVVSSSAVSPTETATATSDARRADAEPGGEPVAVGVAQQG